MLQFLLHLKRLWIIKYACRHGRKNGEGGVKDVKKIIHYAELLLELDYANETQEEWTD